MSAYGFEIVQTLIVDTEPDEYVKRAMSKINAAESNYLAGLVVGLRDSVFAFSMNAPGTTSKDFLDMVLVTQYFVTMKEIGALSESNPVFITHGPGTVKDIASQIRDGLLQVNTTQN